MYESNFEDTKGKLALLIYDLAIHEEEIRNRLPIVFAYRGNLVEQQFPKEFQDDWKEIYSLMTSKPKSEHESSYQNSLKDQTNTACSDIVRKICDLYVKIRDRKEEMG